MIPEESSDKSVPVAYLSRCYACTASMPQAGWGIAIGNRRDRERIKLKNYLKTSAGYIKNVVNKLRLYWKTLDYLNYWQKCAVQKRTISSLYAGNPLFAQVLGCVHDYPFKLEADEIAKILKNFSNQMSFQSCTCSARIGFGVPCVHIIGKYKMACEPLNMLYFQEYLWFKYSPPGYSSCPKTVQADQVYDPRVDKERKGRARGTKNTKHSKIEIGHGSTVLNRREQSWFKVPLLLSNGE